MSGEKFGNKAVGALLDYFESNFTTQLRAVETAESLTANTLTDPVDYIPARLPKDNMVPIVLVYCNSSSELEKEPNLMRHDCEIALHFVGDADVETGQLRERQYETAMLQTLNADRTLGGNVVQAVLQDIDTDASKTADAQTRHAVAMGVEVITWDG